MLQQHKLNVQMVGFNMQLESPINDSLYYCDHNYGLRCLPGNLLEFKFEADTSGPKYSVVFQDYLNLLTQEVDKEYGRFWYRIAIDGVSERALEVQDEIEQLLVELGLAGRYSVVQDELRIFIVIQLQMVMPDMKVKIIQSYVRTMEETWKLPFFIKLKGEFQEFEPKRA